jgi:hypothetical protein
VGQGVPRQAQVRDGLLVEAELGEDSDDQAGPQVRGLRVAEFRAGPAKGLFQEPERVLDIEAAEGVPATAGPNARVGHR